MTDGGLDAFFGGLETLVGPPNPNLEEQLEREHTAMTDSTMLFRTTNYGIDTRSDLEFYCAPTADSPRPVRPPPPRVQVRPLRKVLPAKDGVGVCQADGGGGPAD